MRGSWGGRSTSKYGVYSTCLLAKAVLKSRAVGPSIDPRMGLVGEQSAVSPLAGPSSAGPMRTRSVLELIGNTPLLSFKRVADGVGPVEVLAKAEWYNPGGSVKD